MFLSGIFGKVSNNKFAINRSGTSGFHVRQSGLTSDRVELSHKYYKNPLDKYRCNIPYNGSLKVEDDVFKQSRLPQGICCPWKIHLYATDPQEHEKMLNAVGPYLDDIGVLWKTAKNKQALELLNCYQQRGKAFTIYPRGKRDFEKIARDIDYIIRANNLQVKNSGIIGDNQLGKTGRIFYRYTISTGAAKNNIYSLSGDAYYQNNEKNRGKNRYLADDMTIYDDPWYGYNPASDAIKFADNINGVPVQDVFIWNSQNREVKLNPNTFYSLDGITDITIAGKYNLNLSHPYFGQLLSIINDGQYITIGRAEDCHFRVGADDTDVSRHHLMILRKGQEFFIKDLSKNGTSVTGNNFVQK